MFNSENERASELRSRIKELTEDLNRDTPRCGMEKGEICIWISQYTEWLSEIAPLTEREKQVYGYTKPTGRAYAMKREKESERLWNKAARQVAFEETKDNIKDVLAAIFHKKL